MKRLIINADDLGFSQEINQAIKKCYETGSITGSSLMACGDCFDDAVSMLKDLNVATVGVHLVITGDCTPLTKDDVFVSGYKDIFLQAMTGKLDKTGIYDEFKAQVEKIKGAGLEITHLDSHEHVHMFPGILEICLDLAVEFNIPFIRFPDEPCGIVWKEFSLKDMVRHVALKLFAKNAQTRVERSGIKHNDVFLGHFHSGRITDTVMEHFLNSLKEGTTEIAFHPAIESASFLEKFPWYKNASMEFATLISGKWKDLAKEEGIELVSH